MRVLDLFCGAGGASMGYHQAWPDADIFGIDNVPQPNYPFTFIQDDATALDNYDDFDFIHASPPCQAYSTLRHSPGAKDYDDWQLPFIRQLLESFGAEGKPWVIENVVGAPLRDPVTLCGSMFNELRTAWQEHPEGLTRYYGLRRHRLFETSFLVITQSCNHVLPVLGVYGDLSLNARRSTRGIKAGIEQARDLMGIDWMTPQEIVQAIPPAYTKFIAEQIGEQHAGT